jgi:hypothetical protein
MFNGHLAIKILAHGHCVGPRFGQNLIPLFTMHNRSVIAQTPLSLYRQNLVDLNPFIDRPVIIA